MTWRFHVILLRHPFKTRWLVSMAVTKVTTLLVVLKCITFNMPRFFEYKIECMQLLDGDKIYFVFPGFLKTRHNLFYAYIWIYFFSGIFLPLIALAFCNLSLVHTLWISTKLRQRYQVRSAHVKSNYKITLILVTIISMFIVLVSPAEILFFLSNRLKDALGESPHYLVLAVEFTNVLQTLNFSCNFLIYFILNGNWRRGRTFDLCVCFPWLHYPNCRRFQPVNNPRRHIIKPRETKVWYKWVAWEST